MNLPKFKLLLAAILALLLNCQTDAMSIPRFGQLYQTDTKKGVGTNHAHYIAAIIERDTSNGLLVERDAGDNNQPGAITFHVMTDDKGKMEGNMRIELVPVEQNCSETIDLASTSTAQPTPRDKRLTSYIQPSSTINSPVASPSADAILQSIETNSSNEKSDGTPQNDAADEMSAVLKHISNMIAETGVESSFICNSSSCFVESDEKTGDTVTRKRSQPELEVPKANSEQNQYQSFHLRKHFSN